MRLELDQGPPVERGEQFLVGEAGAEPAPQDEVGVAGHGVGGVVLQDAEALHRLDQPTRPVGIEQLGPHGDPPGLLAGQFAHGPIPSVLSIHKRPARRAGAALILGAGSVRVTTPA